ncbi:hypothetical protein AV530_015291 [Patagioenas fasciata monilis]|uniref:Uncharacterized protein n=1 Tax=Patagioenas fasciata monilis TaxID=372326 RepID=A0A1V4K1K0_PATFA|nr:hypothetical protein AV530_015291 [Patagioenas fasciata monilis]
MVKILGEKSCSAVTHKGPHAADTLSGSRWKHCVDVRNSRHNRAQKSRDKEKLVPSLRTLRAACKQSAP